LQMKNVIITGASGFVGSFLVEKSLSLGYNTWAAIRNSSNKKYLQDERIQFIDLKYNSVEELTKQFIDFKNQFGKIDYFIHNAGVTKCLNPKDFDTINYKNTVNLIDALQVADCIPSKFLLMSSLSAFGQDDEINYTPIKLTDIPHPNTAYGISKLKAEKYLQKTKNFPYIILRPTGIYGPRELDYFLMLKTITSGFNIGAGYRPQHLTFIYVKDLVDIAFKALNSNLKNKAYFVADGDVYTGKEYTSLVKEALNKKQVLKITIPLTLLKLISGIAQDISKITKKPSTLNPDKFKIMKQRNWECDIQPLVNDLNFEPEYPLKKGLEEAIAWYKNEGWL